MTTPGQAHYVYEPRSPNGSEMNPLAHRLIQAARDWQQAASICLADETEERLLLVAPAGDAFVAIYFTVKDTQQTKQIERVVSNSNSAALLMLMRLVQQFKA